MSAAPVTQAILLAAGFGTRLKPLTDKIPKCLIPINGVPLLDIWLQQLSRVGIERFFINTHYMAGSVVDFVQNHELAEKIVLFHEPNLLGTAGTVRAIVSKFNLQDETLLVAHADNLCLCSWQDFIAMQQCEDHILTMMAFETDSPRSCGILEVDGNSMLRQFHEKVAEPPGNLANAAVYIFKPAVLQLLDSLDASENDLSINVLPKLIGKIKVWPTDGYLRDIGTPESYQQAQIDIEKSCLLSPAAN